MHPSVSRTSIFARLTAVVLACSLMYDYSEPVHAAPLPTLTCTPPSTDPEIAALARSLRYDMSLIYEYVYYNVDYSPSWGSKKGAFGTYLDQRGNNIDQNVLFVELLRQSCISANFRSGGVAFPTATLANLLGVQNDKAQVLERRSRRASNAGPHQ